MITDQVKQQLHECLKDRVLFEEPLARYTTMRVGGPAEVLVFASSIDDIQALLKIALDNKIPVFPIGWGSNLLIRDGGIRGIVLSLARDFQKIEMIDMEGDEVRLEVQAALRVPSLLDYTVTHGLGGLEFMAGIPATVGGAIWMNAGTREGEIGQRVVNVTLVTRQGRIRKLEQADCGFSYRSHKLPAGSVVIETCLQLQRTDPRTIKSRIDKFKKYRLDTQPLNLPNSGSIFKNPGKKKYAGQLIEEAGLKGVRIGQARISEKHANFIVNEGQATAKDVIALIGLIKDKVKEKFNIRLETEISIIGDKGQDEG